jgi:putative sigma-54 modulation protein
MAEDRIKTLVKGKNLEVTDALRQYAEKRSKKLKKFFPEMDVSVDVVLGIERELHIAEVTLQVQNLLIRGESKTDDMYASIDASMDRVERQLLRHKTRLQKRFQGSLKLGEINSGSLKQAFGENDGNLPKLVRTKRFNVKPMDTEEAVMQMELLGHDFFVFLDAETEQVNVLYRRRDGNFGLIEPEI